MLRMNWRSIPSHPRYKVSPNGVVIGLRGAVLSPSTSAHGYYQVRVDRLTRKVHHLVAEAFIGPRPMGLVVNHIDGDKKNNANLEYVTQRENVMHAHRLGLIARSKNSGRRSRFDQAIVSEIKIARERGDARCAILARFNISSQHFYAITNGKRCLPR